MRIAILTTGSRGDVQPYVALALALQRAGHRVRVPVHRRYRDLVVAHGLEYHPLEGEDPQGFIDRPDIQATLQRGDLLGLIATVLRQAGPLFSGIFDGFWHACQEADAVITSMAFFGAYDGAGRLGLPSVHSLLTPVYPTAYYPSPFLAVLPRPGRVGNRLTHALLDQVWWQTFRVVLNRWRAHRLKLPPHPFLGPYRRMRRVDRLPTLLAFSSAVVPPPPDWPPWVHVTGYWTLPPARAWQPPSDLLRFLGDGPPPVYVGYGSVGARQPEQMARLAIEALDRCGQRGVLLSPWAAQHRADLSEAIYATSSVPHAWLFPRMAAIVHHGGAGTTAAALRAGVPNVVVPFLGDQVFWGQRVQALGAGPPSIRRSRLTVERLAVAIDAAVGDPQVRDRAESLGAALRAEDGVGRAVDVICRTIGSGR